MCMIIPFCWTVIKGTQRATESGFPTANLEIHDATIENWTYKINVVVWTTTIPWMGVFFKDRNLFEAHLFWFDWDLYGEKIMVYPLRKIRDNRKFSGLEDLKQQLEEDKQAAMDHQMRVMTFWTFDHFHEWHRYYLSIARRYGDSLITVIARDETVQKVKWFTTTHNEQQRLEAVEESWVATHVLLWSTEDHYACLTQRLPDVICLWYDQRSFDWWLITWYQDKELELPQIVRIDSHHPDTFKSSFYRT